MESFESQTLAIVTSGKGVVRCLDILIGLCQIGTRQTRITPGLLATLTTIGLFLLLSEFIQSLAPHLQTSQTKHPACAF